MKTVVVSGQPPDGHRCPPLPEVKACGMVRHVWRKCQYQPEFRLQRLTHQALFDGGEKSTKFASTARRPEDRRRDCDDSKKTSIAAKFARNQMGRRSPHLRGRLVAYPQDAVSAELSGVERAFSQPIPTAARCGPSEFPPLPAARGRSRSDARERRSGCQRSPSRWSWTFSHRAPTERSAFTLDGLHGRRHRQPPAALYRFPQPGSSTSPPRARCPRPAATMRGRIAGPVRAGNGAISP